MNEELKPKKKRYVIKPEHRHVFTNETRGCRKRLSVEKTKVVSLSMLEEDIALLGSIDSNKSNAIRVLIKFYRERNGLSGAAKTILL